MAARTIVAGLHAVNALISGGNLEGARRELVELAKDDSAGSHIGQFVDFSRKLRQPEIIEALLSGTLPNSARVLCLFSLIDLYQQLGDRPSAFRSLQELAPICADSNKDLKRVAACYARLGEFSVALEIRERLVRSDPRNHLLNLDVVETQIPLNKKRAYSLLKEIMSAPDVPTAAWERASYLYERLAPEMLGKSDEALQAITKAVAQQDSGFGARRRLVELLQRMGQTRRARAELAVLLVECRTDPTLLRMLGDLAFKLPDRPLALQFAEAQHHCAPANPEGILYLAYHLRIAGDRIQAKQLLCSLLQVERRRANLSDQQRIRLAEGLAAVGEITLVNEAIAEAEKREPKSTATRTFAARTALLARFSNAASPTMAAGDDLDQVRISLLSRLRKIFRA